MTVKSFKDDQGLGFITHMTPARTRSEHFPNKGTDRHGLKQQEEDHDGKAHP